MTKKNEAAARVGEFLPIIFCAQRLLAAGKVMGVCWESCDGGRSEMGLPVILMTLTKKATGGVACFYFNLCCCERHDVLQRRNRNDLRFRASPL